MLGRAMRIGIILTFVLFTEHPTFAQTLLGAGAIGGTVRDESGAMVADANVTLTEESKGLSRESRSDRGGSFLFSGNHRGRVFRQGRKARLQPGTDQRLED